MEDVTQRSPTLFTPPTIKVTRGTGGGYSYEIKASGETFEDVEKVIEAIEGRLKAKYPTTKKAKRKNEVELDEDFNGGGE